MFDPTYIHNIVQAMREQGYLIAGPFDELKTKTEDDTKPGTLDVTKDGPVTMNEEGHVMHVQ